MIIGIDLGGTNARAGLVKDSTIIKIEEVILSNRNSKEKTLEQLFSIITPVAQHDIEERELWNISTDNGKADR